MEPISESAQSDAYFDRMLDEHFDRKLHDYRVSQHDCGAEGHVWDYIRNLLPGAVRQCEICGEVGYEPNEDL